MSSTSTTSTSASASPSSSADSSDNGPTDVGSKSLIFGFAFFAILIAFLFASVAYQRWAAQRQRTIRIALGILDDDYIGRRWVEEPRFWHTYVSVSGEKPGLGATEPQWRWRDMKPFAARWRSASSRASPPGETPTHRLHPSFVQVFLSGGRPPPCPPHSRPQKPPKPPRNPLDADPNAMQVAVIIAMPSQAAARPMTPGEDEQLIHFEIGVADVRAERDLLS